MRLQIQRLWIQTMQENTIAHIIVGTGRTVFIRKYFFSQQTPFLLLITQNVLSAEYS
jgi:hypothetical protein